MVLSREVASTLLIAIKELSKGEARLGAERPVSRLFPQPGQEMIGTLTRAGAHKGWEVHRGRIP